MLMQIQFIFGRTGHLNQCCIEREGSFDSGTVALRILDWFSVRANNIRIGHIISGIRCTFECNDLIPGVWIHSFKFIKDRPRIHAAGNTISCGVIAGKVIIFITSGNGIKEKHLLIILGIILIHFYCIQPKGGVWHQCKITSNQLFPWFTCSFLIRFLPPLVKLDKRPVFCAVSRPLERMIKNSVWIDCIDLESYITITVFLFVDLTAGLVGIIRVFGCEKHMIL